MLERWISNQALFNLHMAKSLPHLAAEPARVRRVASDADSTTWEVRVTVRNDGEMPTALRQADLVKIVRPDRVVLRLDDLRTGGDDPQVRWLEPGNGSLELGYLQPRESREAVLTFRTFGVQSFRGTFELLSTRGGVVRGEVVSPGG